LIRISYFVIRILLLMQGLRFNHVYALLLLVCAATAFIPHRFTDPLCAQFQGIYAPVSRPALAIVELIHSRLNREPTPDAISPGTPRSDADIREENLELHQSLALLTNQIQYLQQRIAEREKLGTLADLCTPYTVSATDAGSGESLVIGGGNLAGLKAKMPAVFSGGLAGWLQTPGLVGTRVRLITDRGFRVTGTFIRFIKGPTGRTELVPIATHPVLVAGEGDNTLLVEAMHTEDAQKINVDDWVELNDSDWPAPVQGVLVGRVVAPPSSSRQSIGFDQIRLEPATRLMQLRELMIVDKLKSPR
jgi:cell shape-determining protein MreC